MTWKGYGTLRFVRSQGTIQGVQYFELILHCRDGTFRALMISYFVINGKLGRLGKPKASSALTSSVLSRRKKDGCCRSLHEVDTPLGHVCNRRKASILTR
jgi:hypothetical protein